MLLDGRDKSGLSRNKPINECKQNDCPHHWSTIVHVGGGDWHIRGERQPDDDKSTIAKSE